MDDWNEIKTAAAVARAGTIAAAATTLGVHRATVNRHVEHLERALGAKLFQRHHRGMTPTELGTRLLQVADATQAQFGELLREAKTQSQLTGNFTVTSVEVIAPVILPWVRRFQARQQALCIRYVASDTVLKLAYGEADIAFRIGLAPSEPDNIVRPFTQVQMGIYATTGYLDRYGLPTLAGDLSQHYFVGPDADAPNAPFIAWARAHFPKHRWSLASSSVSLMWSAVLQGVGIGFLPDFIVQANTDQLVEIAAPRQAWSETIWSTTHVDLHRSRKVQAFLDILPASA